MIPEFNTIIRIRSGIQLLPKISMNKYITGILIKIISSANPPDIGGATRMPEKHKENTDPPIPPI
jgi:hypothetical protein